MPTHLWSPFKRASQVVPQPWRSVAGFSPWGPAFDPTTGCVGAWVSKVTGTEVFPSTSVFPVSTIPQMHHSNISCMTSDTIKSRQLTAPLNNTLKSFIQLAVPISSGNTLRHWPKHRHLSTAHNDRMFYTTIILWHKCHEVMDVEVQHPAF
jgi:hypothetical protein